MTQQTQTDAQEVFDAMRRALEAARDEITLPAPEFDAKWGRDFEVLDAIEEALALAEQVND